MRRIMVVDDSRTILSIAKASLEKDYEVLVAKSGKEALMILGCLDVLPDLILLDVVMPKMGGFEVIREFKKDVSLSRIPVIFLTGQVNPDSELEGLTLGAIDYIKKPFSIPLLKKRVHLHLQLVEQKNRLQLYNEELEQVLMVKSKTILELQGAIITTVAELIEKKDGFTGGHVYRVQEYVKTLLQDLIETNMELDFSNTDIDLIASCSKLHDLGKIGIKDDILLKSEKLTDEEMDIIKLHPMIGAEALEYSMRFTEKNEFLVYAYEMVKGHHERWDGSGYPDGLKGEEIPFLGRVVAVADVYDALTSERPYKKPFSHQKSMDIIKQGRGTHFDPAVVDAFLRVESEFDEIHRMRLQRKSKKKYLRINTAPPANTGV